MGLDVLTTEAFETKDLLRRVPEVAQWLPPFGQVRRARAGARIRAKAGARVRARARA